jgi:hypothetical protein
MSLGDLESLLIACDQSIASTKLTGSDRLAGVRPKAQPSIRKPRAIFLEEWSGYTGIHCRSLSQIDKFITALPLHRELWTWMNIVLLSFPGFAGLITSLVKTHLTEADKRPEAASFFAQAVSIFIET